MLRRAGYICDSIHGNIRIEPFQRQLLDTPHFQRLHRLKQTGAADVVYPSATHTRFAHCLGVGHLAGRMYDLLIAEQPELQAPAIYRKLVVMAGMAHDLGHGPHSHAFEAWVAHAHPTKQFCHERMSVTLLRDAAQRGLLPFLVERDDDDDSVVDCTDDELRQQRLSVIAHMIQGTKHEHAHEVPERHRWMLDIVHNSLHGVDVDKMDYLVRDTQTIFGAPPATINIERILCMARVVDGRVCFHAKVAPNLYQLFALRLNLHQQVYAHKTCIVTKVMFRDALDHIDAALHIADRIDTATDYLTLDDTLFATARFMATSSRGSKRAHLVKAVCILDDLEARRLYVRVASEIFERNAQVPTVDEVIDKAVCDAVLDRNDLTIEVRRFDYGAGDANPMQERIFFEWSADEDDACAGGGSAMASSCRIRPRRVTHMLPRQFSERRAWLFCRRRDLDPKDLDAMRVAFHTLLQRRT